MNYPSVRLSQRDFCIISDPFSYVLTGALSEENNERIGLEYEL